MIVATLFVSRTAGAYCRSTTEKKDKCTVEGDECCALGKPFFWPNRCVGYNLHRAGSKQIAFTDFERIAAAAFAVWGEASCTSEGGTVSRTSIEARYLGPVDCADMGHNEDAPNQHVIVFRDAWPPPGMTDQDASGVLAFTRVQYNAKTGEILGADMEINGTPHISIDDEPLVPPDGYDLQSVMTHEAGHFFGLGHSGDLGATMYGNYNKQNRTPSIMRTITLDDVRGICAAYPPSGVRVTADNPALPTIPCDPTPRNGLSSACVEETGCCKRAAIRDQSPSGWIAFTMGALALTLRRRPTRLPR